MVSVFHFLPLFSWVILAEDRSGGPASTNSLHSLRNQKTKFHTSTAVKALVRVLVPLGLVLKTSYCEGIGKG